MVRKSPFDREFHEEAADDPRMQDRLRARNIIMVAAAILIPLSVVMLIVTMVSWKFDPSLPSDLWASSIGHPFASAAVLMLALNIHRQGAYGLSIGIVLLPILNVGYFIWNFILWMQT